jgi:GT2 family glycosyltransferase
MNERGLIIMVCRNALEFSKPCLASALAQTVPVDVLVVNNASTDGTTEWLRHEQSVDEAVFAMQFPEVLSVAEVWNRALRWAWINGSHQEALVINNDTELQPETYEILKRETGAAGMLTCISVRNREELIVPPTFSRRPHPDFSCFMIQRWAFQKVGGFDENCIGAYCEDCVFHVEAHRRQVACECISLPFLHHACGTLTHADKEEQRRIKANADHNREYFFSKYRCYPGTNGYAALFH